MVKSDTILMAGLVGVVGYGLLKSDFFKGVGEVGTGIGEAVGGLGSGIGNIAGDIAQTTGNVADFFNPIGQLGKETAFNTALIGELFRENERREFNQEQQIDTNAFNLSNEIESQEQAKTAITDARQSNFRNDITEKFKTSATKNFFDFALSGKQFFQNRSDGFKSFFSRPTAKSFAKSQASSLSNKELTNQIASSNSNSNALTQAINSASRSRNLRSSRSSSTTTSTDAIQKSKNEISRFNKVFKISRPMRKTILDFI